MRKIFNFVLSLSIPRKWVEKREILVKDINSFIDKNWDLLLLGANLLCKEDPCHYSIKSNSYGDVEIHTPKVEFVMAFYEYYSLGRFKMKESNGLLSKEDIFMIIRELNVLLSKARKGLERKISIEIKEEED